MYQLLIFLKRISVFAVFVLIEILALRYYSSSTLYSKAKLVSISNATLGTLSNQIYQAKSYFKLAEENRLLSEELALLRTKLDKIESGNLDSTRIVRKPEADYIYTPARVISNSFTRQRNYIILDKGERDNIRENTAVIAAGNIIGFVIKTSERFSVAISLINTDFRSSGHIAGSDFFGSIFWDGKDYEYLTLSEISKYASINVGDTIVTTGYSSIFPPNINIGTVESFELKNDTYYDIKVKIGINMSALSNVTLAYFISSDERQNLLKEARNSTRK